MRSNIDDVITGTVLPEETAFENYLYSYKKVPKDKKQIVEKYFLAQEVDSKGSTVFYKILESGVDSLSSEDRYNWSRFLIASRIRIPEIIKDLKKGATEELRRSLTEDHEEYLKVKGDVTDSTLLQWVENNFVGLIDNLGLIMLPEVVNDPHHVKVIDNMYWWVEDVSGSSVKLLTSDRPLWVSAGLMKPNCLLALPLTPVKIFFASNNKNLKEALMHHGVNRLVRRCNESLVSQASRFVYGRAKLSFIEKRWANLYSS